MSLFSFFFFNDTATTEIYTLSLHDALPICLALGVAAGWKLGDWRRHRGREGGAAAQQDRKSTRLNSSHLVISYAVFCLKKKTTSRFSTSPRTLVSGAHRPIPSDAGLPRSSF